MKKRKQQTNGMMQLLRRGIGISLCIGFVCALPTASFAVEDDLDQFFEDYFSDDFATEETTDTVEVTSPAPAEPVEAEPITATSDESLVLADVSEADASTEPARVSDAVPALSEREAAIDVVLESYLPTLDDADMSYLDSYVDSAPRENWSYDDVYQDAREAARSVVMDKTIKFLIGEEVDKPTIEIRGDAVQRTDAEMRSLKECIIEATKRHLPIDIAKEKVLLYRRHIRKAMRDLFPSVTGSWEDSDNRFGGAVDGFTEVDTVKLSVRQPIYAGGALWSKVRENQANLKMAMAEYTKIYSDLALEVSTAYFNLSKARTMLSHREGLLDKARKSLSLSEEKYAANLISEIEHLNVQSQESQLNHNMQQAKEDIELALLELQKSMYLDLDMAVPVLDLDQYSEVMDIEAELEEKDGKGEVDEKKLDELIVLAYDNRPEFVIGESKVAAKRYAEKAERAKWLPQLSVFWDMGRDREWKAGDPAKRPKFGRWETVYHMGIECSWNVFGNKVMYAYDNDQQAPRGSGYNTGGKGNWSVKNTIAVGVLDGLDQFAVVKEKEIERKEAILEFELSEKDMVSEVKESYYNFNRAKIQMRSVQKKLAYREKLVELARHRSEINEIQISEYLQAEIDLVEERNTYYQAMVDYFIARASVNKAIGVSNFIDIDQLPPELQL